MLSKSGLGRIAIWMAACLPLLAQTPAPRVFRASTPALGKMPLPPAVEVTKIVAAPDSIWYLGRDCSTLPCLPVVYSWSQPGLTQYQVPDGGAETLEARDFVLAGNRLPLLLTNQGVMELVGDQFQASSAFSAGQPRALAGRPQLLGQLWAIQDSTSVFYLPVYPPSGQEKRLTLPAPIQAWSVDQAGGLRVSAGDQLYHVTPAGGISEEPNSSSLQLQNVTALFSDANDNLWVSQADGRLIRKTATSFDEFGPKDGLPGTPVIAFGEDSRGAYYFLFQAGAGQPPQLYGVPATSRFRLQPDFTRFELPGLNSVIRTIAVDTQDGTWIAAGPDATFRMQGLNAIQWSRAWSHPDTLTAKAAPAAAAKPGAAAPLFTYPSLASPSLTSHALTVGGVPTGKFITINNSQGLADNHVSSIVSDSLGNIYFTTGYTWNWPEQPNTVGKGISRWDHRIFTTFNTSNSALPSNTVHASIYDPSNNVIWFGTDNGLARFNPNTTAFTAFLPGVNARDLRIDGSGNLWVATLGQGVYKLRLADGTTLAQYTASNTPQLGSNQVSALALDGLNNLYAGTDGSNVSELNIASNVWTNLNLPLGNDSGRVFDLETDLSNNLWVALPFQGIMRRTPGGAVTQFLNQTPQVGPKFQTVERCLRIYRDPSGNLWFGYGDFGAVGTPNTGFTFLAASQVTAGVPAFQNYSAANFGFPLNSVISFAAENNTGAMWFGAPGGGAWRFGGPVDMPGWPQLLTGATYFSSPVLADLNGDGKLEIIVGDTAGIVYAFKNDGSLLWSYDAHNAILPPRTAGGITIQSSPAVADVDGDGLPEVVVGLGGQTLPNIPVGQGGVLILSNTGQLKRIFYTFDNTDPTRSLKQDGYSEGVFASPVLANVDDDPEPEIMVGALDNFFWAWNADGSTIYARDNDGDGQFDEDPGPGDFTPWTPFDPTDDFPGWRGIDDDHNGDIDEGNNADDDEDGLIDEDPPEWPFVGGSDTTLSSAVVGDILHNGKPAIIYGTDHTAERPGDTTGGYLFALDPHSNPLPGFTSAAPGAGDIHDGATPLDRLPLEEVIWSSPVLVDLDNDGNWEIIHGTGLNLVSGGSSLIGQLVYAWKNDGSSFIPGANGRFATTQGRTMASFAVGDINNDGKPELIIATTSLRDVNGNDIDANGAITTAANAVGQLVYAFNTDGSLVPGFPVRPYVISPDANLVGSPILADVNGDGFLEIIIPVGSGLIVLDHNGRAVPGMGLFENLQDISFTGSNSSTPAVGDIDGDGILELVYAMGTGSGSGGILHVMKLGPVNSTVQRSWPMFRRIPSHNAIFDVLLADAQAYDRGSNTVVTVQAFAGRQPIASVVADLSGFGGSSAQTLYDDGTHGDQVANDGFFTFQLSSAAAAGRYLIPITATDGAGHTDSKGIFYLHAGAGKLLSVSKAAIDFGNVGQGLDQEMHFSIANAGNLAVTISGISSSNAEFTVAIPGPTYAIMPIYPTVPPQGFPQVLQPGQTLIVRLRLHPGINNALGARSATLTIHSDDTTNPSRTIGLTGTATALANPKVQLAATTLGYNSAVGSKQDLTLGINSIGTDPLIIKTIQSSNPAFTIYKLSNPAAPRKLEPGVSAPYVIRFKPTQAGTVNANLTITTNDPANPSLTVALIGTATGGTAGCTYTLNPTSATVGENGLNGQNFTVSTAANCAWTIQMPTWLAPFPLSGTGNATINFDIYPNFSTTARTGTITVGSANFTVTEAGATETSDQRFVKLLYFNFFGRLPTQSEIDFQVSQGVVPQGRTQVAYNFLTSPEFNAGGRYVAGLYVGILGRDAEYNGWLFQRNALAQGFTTQLSALTSFISSAEYVAKYGNTTDSQFVTILYQNILLRSPSPSELAFQIQGVQQLGRTQIAQNFLTSQEFQNDAGPRLTAFLLYACLLQRDPLVAELNSEAAQVTAGATLQSLIATIISSAEFTGIF